MKKSDPPVIVEQKFNASAETVWEAITEVQQMRNWFFDNIPEFKPEVGFETQFLVKSESREFLHQWKITEVIPNKLITYNWKYKKYPGNSYVTFELIDQSDLTKLKLTHTVTKDFPQDIPEFKRESCIGGWQFFIKKNLKEYLEG